MINNMSIYSILGITHFVLAFLVSIHIIMTKKQDNAAIGWLGIVILSPFLGSLAYFFFGINRIQRKASDLRETRVTAAFAKAPIKIELPLKITSIMQELLILGYKITHQEFIPHTQITPLLNGDNAYPEMLKAIHNSQQSVAFSTYIFSKDAAGLAFLQALSAAQNRGVQVRVLIDDMGNRQNIDRNLKKKGIKTARFLPTSIFKNMSFLNLRNHRKILLVDGQTGFIGGINIRQDNLLKNTPPKATQDIHFKITGPIINQINHVFEEDWWFASNKKISLPKWNAASKKPRTNIYTRVISDGPDIDINKLQWIVLGAINQAKKNIKIITPYFLPNDIVCNALQAAALRGVLVEVLIPQKNNIFYMSWAMQANFHKLVAHGLKIYKTQPPFDHSKIFLVDNIWSLIGSPNWDERSFRLNFEISLECLSQSFNAKLQKIFQQKKANAHLVSTAELAKLSPLIKLRNNFTKLFSPYL